MDDGTAFRNGFAQILITYTLGAVTLVCCRTLHALAGVQALSGAGHRGMPDLEMRSREFAKPIARWQIWLGKWLGIVSLECRNCCVGPRGFEHLWFA